MKDNPFSLSGKTILITGAASGIGKSVSIAASTLGATLILVDINNENLQLLVKELNNNKHVAYCLDLTNSTATTDCIKENFPLLDGIVHCAGVGITLPFKFCNENELRRIMDINFFAPILLTQQLLKQKKINIGASIVYMTSIDGTVCGHIGNSMYASSKGAIMGSVRSQALELAPRKIRVNCVSPARVNTPLIHRDNISQEEVVENIKLYPMKRYAEPEEIAYYIIYLLSDTSTYTTGSNLIIDGGFTLS